METYFISLLFVTSFSVYMLRAWFNSTLSAQIFNLFIDKENRLYTKDDVDNYLINKPFFIYSLLTCPICMAFHLSLWASIFTNIANIISGTGSFSLISALSMVFISSAISSHFGDIKEKKRDSVKAEKPKVVQKTQKPQVPKLTVTETPPTTKNEKTVEDFGGFLLEKDGTGKKSVIGTTKMYTDYVSKVFDESLDCNFPKCKEWRKQYNEEIEALQIKYAEDNKACPECIKSGVRRKFYDIIKGELESLKRNAKH